MSRQYHITLSEQELNAVIGELGIGYHYATDTLLSAYNKLKEVKDKSYTNFDKIKDEMTVDALYEEANESLYDAFYNLANKNKNIFVHYSSLSEYLKSEVKENAKVKICDLCNKRLDEFDNRKVSLISPDFGKKNYDLCPECFKNLKNYIISKKPKLGWPDEKE